MLQSRHLTHVEGNHKFKSMKMGAWHQLDLFRGASTKRELRRWRASGGEVLDHSQRIAGFLTVLLPEPVDITFTNNRSTMISYTRKAGRMALRLHRIFRLADDDLLESLALFLGRKDKSASEEIDRFIAAHRDEIKGNRRLGPKTLRTMGTHRDLGIVLDKVSAGYFGGTVDVRIGWGRAPARKRRRQWARKATRALATYSYDEKVIRVSPVLDAPDVPDYVLEWIVYHELLHHVLPARIEGARSRHHTRSFRALEHGFERYEEAKAWESANLDRLLS